jgi:hypothetical protein
VIVRLLLKSAGDNAGKIWKILQKDGVLHKEIIIKKAKLKEAEFYTGLGWLARENKIIQENEGEFKLGETNLTENIGSYAGKIWKILDIWGEVDIQSISRLANIDKKDVYTTIGWLAREDKIFENEKGMYKLKNLQ